MALEEIRAQRLEKLHRIEEAGMDPYPVTSNRTHDVVAFFGDYERLEATKSPVAIAGRIVSFREHGGAMFVDVNDGSGKVQAYLQKDVLGEDSFDFFQKNVDTGDFVEFTGHAYTTKRGMRSVHVEAWRMLVKSLLPIPDQWFGLKDEDERYRKRYLDILLSEETANRIRRRSKFWNVIRTYLLEQGYVEVETPVLETTTGGAEAAPFVTHHNALDIDVYLRISAGELWQKRLMVAGLPKVFEIGRIFRNEGMSAEHAQDYTQLEFYEAYKDYRQGMDMIRDLYRRIADEVYGTRVFTVRGVQVDFNKEWEQYDFSALMQNAYKFDPREAEAMSIEELHALLAKATVPTEGVQEVGRAVDLLWKKIRKDIVGPGFLVNVPVYLEPLAKKDPSDKRVVERFQVMLAGSEMGKGFSELNDPIDQAERFKRQGDLRAAGDEEAQMPDAEYVEALEYGMPLAFGFGVSERLFSTLEGVPIREGQIFPLMRPRPLRVEVSEKVDVSDKAKIDRITG